MQWLLVPRLAHWRLGLSALATGLVLGLLMLGAASAATPLRVCPTGPPACEYVAVQDALDAASDGDRIVIIPGIYTGALVIGKSIELYGAGAGQTTISGGGPGPVVTVNAGQSVTISGVTITGGGRGISNFGTLALMNSTVSGNAPLIGAGIRNLGTLALTRSTVSGNNSLFIGGGILSVEFGTSLTLSHSTVSGNSANDGGGIFAGGTVTLSDSIVADNTSGNNGGGILVLSQIGQTMTLTDTTVTGNTANSGGGIRASGGSTMTLIQSTVRGNAPNDLAGS